MFSGPPMLVVDGFEGEILAGRDLLERRRIEHDVDIAQGRRDAVKIAHVPDAEGEQFAEIAVDDFVGGGRALEVFHAHEVLLGFVAGEDDDLARTAHFAAEQAPHQNLA